MFILYVVYVVRLTVAQHHVGSMTEDVSGFTDGIDNAMPLAMDIADCEECC